MAKKKKKFSLKKPLKTNNVIAKMLFNKSIAIKDDIPWYIQDDQLKMINKKGMHKVGSKRHIKEFMDAIESEIVEVYDDWEEIDFVEVVKMILDGGSKNQKIITLYNGKILNEQSEINADIFNRKMFIMRLK